MSLRILQVGPFPYPAQAGSQVYLGGLSRALFADGHEVVLACYHQSGGPAFREIDIVRAERVPGAQIARSGPHWSRPVQDLGLAKAIERVLRTRSIDVIAAHNVEGPLAAWLGRRRARQRVPIVYHQHTLMGEELQTYLPGAAWAPWLGQTIDAVVPRFSDGAVALSERGGAWLEARGLPTAVIPPGVVPDEVCNGDRERARVRWGLKGPVVLYAGNVDPYQDLGLLVRAMREVSATLLIASHDPAARQYAAPAVRVVETPGLPELSDALAAADLGALPRRVCAGFPMKLLNNLAAGLPSVCVGDSARALPGVIATRPEHLARTIAGILADRDRMNALRATLSRDRQTLTWNARAREVAKFYHQVIGIHKR